MNRQARQTTARFLRRVSTLAVLLSVPLFISACGDGVSIGSGQDPDPVVTDFPIAYIRAPIPTNANGDFDQQDLREQITFNFGADLFFRDRASPSAPSINITGEMTQGLAAIRDVDIAYDGSAILFAMRFPFDPNLAVQNLPTWNIWRYVFVTGTLERVITSASTAAMGHDIMPKYLPDGRIIFSSTRQTQGQAILSAENKGGFVALDEDRNEYALNLHIMNDDGTGIEQVSYNQSHDLDASVLSNGQIVFSRWDHAGINNEVNLYRMNPDGSDLELLYGAQSHATGTNGGIVQFMQARELGDGRDLALIRPFVGTDGGGELVVIDTPQYVEIAQPTRDNIGILTGPAQEDFTVNDVLTEPGVPSPGGRYSFAYPILDGTGRVLVSWSQCRLIEILPDDGDPATDDTRIVACTDEGLAGLADPNDPSPPVGSFVIAPPLYGIWMYDPRNQTQQPVVVGEEGFMFTEVVAANPRTAPPVVIDGLNTFTLDSSLAAADEAVLNIRSVYDIDGVAIRDIPATADPVTTLAAARPARFLRVVKAVSIPDSTIVQVDDLDFGVNTLQGMREIVGTAMIEPDGSVMMKVPANVPLAVSVLDADGKRISARHQNWIQLRPGQELRCNGCHDPSSLPPISHGRIDAFDSAYAGASPGLLEFPNTDPMWMISEPGQTMAEVRASVTCASVGCSSLEPSMNVIYRDIWSADPAIVAQNVDIDYLYTDLTTAAPATPECEADWQSLCRSVINYIDIIHPLWSQPRPAFDDQGNPVVDGNGMPVDNQCTLCHTQIDPTDGTTVQLPAGQLELTDGLSPDVPDHYHAYRELLVTDNLQELLNGMLVDTAQMVGPPANIAGASLSGGFFDRFEDPADLHYNTLSGAERRLIAEWLDVGAQYYNNPFDILP